MHFQLLPVSEFLLLLPLGYGQVMSSLSLFFLVEISSNLGTERLRILAIPCSENLPMQHSQPLPALETAEMPAARPRVRAGSSDRSASERNLDHRTGRLTHIPQTSAIQILSSLLQSTGFILDSGFFFFFFNLFCYEETKPATSLTIRKKGVRYFSSSA